MMGVVYMVIIFLLTTYWIATTTLIRGITGILLFPAAGALAAPVLQPELAAASRPLWRPRGGPGLCGASGGPARGRAPDRLWRPVHSADPVPAGLGHLANRPVPGRPLMIARRIRAGLLAYGLSPAPAEVLSRYCDALLEQNQVMNLTAITDPEQVADLHMLDSAALLTVADLAGKSVIDVGTGRGFPRSGAEAGGAQHPADPPGQPGQAGQLAGRDRPQAGGGGRDLHPRPGGGTVAAPRLPGPVRRGSVPGSGRSAAAYRALSALCQGGRYLFRQKSGDCQAEVDRRAGPCRCWADG